MKRNFVYTAISLGSRLLVGLMLFLLLARMWGPTQFGLFSFVFSVTMLLALIVDFGFAVYLLREVSAWPAQAADIIGQAFRLKLHLLGLALAVALLVGLSFGSVALPPLLFLPLLLAAVVLSFADFFIAPLRALGRFALEARTVALTNAVQFAFAGSAAWFGGSPATVAWVIVLSRLLYLGMAWRVLNRALPGLELRGHSSSNATVAWRKIWPYGLDGMLYTGLSQLDVVLVRLLFGVQAVGLYSAGQKIVVGVTALAPVVGNVMLPRLAAEAALGDPDFWRTARKTVALMLAVGLCFALPLMVYPAEISHWGFGSSFADLKALLPWFGGILMARYLGMGAGLVAAGAGLQVQRVTSQCFGLLALATVGLLVWLLDARMQFLMAGVAASLSLVVLLNATALLRLFRRGLSRPKA